MLPDDLLALIIQQLNLEDFCAAASTCRGWHAAARKKTAWPIAAGWIAFHSVMVSVPGARPLSQTAWAACKRISVQSMQQLSRLAVELVHVTALSFVSYARYDLFPDSHCRALLERLTSLSTDQVELVQGTSHDKLTSLTIHSNPRTNEEYFKWMRTLSELHSLTHIRLDVHCDHRGEMLGQVLARLANAHRILRSIELPTDEASSGRIFSGLISGHSNNSSLWNLSSIRTLIHAPRPTLLLWNALSRMPRLTNYACLSPSMSLVRKSHLPSLFTQPLDEEETPQLASLELQTCYYHIEHSWLEPCLLTLTELCIHLFDDGLRGPYPRLRRLRLMSGHDFLMRDVVSIAPRLEQLSMNEAMIWRIHNRFKTPTLFVSSLSRLSHFQHLELCNWTWYHPVESTRALVQGMMQSPCWRHVTSPMMPVTIHIRENLSSETLHAIRWHVMTPGSHQLITFRPRIQVSRCPAWVLNLCGVSLYQIVWTRL
jgi:hypothetical protein